MRPRRTGGGSRPLLWYMRTVDVAVSARLASCSMVIRPSSSMHASVLLRSKDSVSIYSNSRDFTFLLGVNRGGCDARSERPGDPGRDRTQAAGQLPDRARRSPGGPAGAVPADPGS